MNKRLALIAGPAVLAIAIFWLATPKTGGPQPGQLAPDFHWIELSGQNVALSHYRGRVVLIDFWATWCTTCEEEQPALISLFDRLHSQGFELLAPSMDEGGRKSLVPYLSNHPIPWKVLLSDSEDARIFQVIGLPTKFLIDRSGVIAKKYIGPVDPQVLERDVRQLIAQEAS